MELNGERINQFSAQEVEQNINNWYNTKISYQFPGGSEPFESWSNITSAKDYGSFTQVNFFY